MGLGSDRALTVADGTSETVICNLPAYFPLSWQQDGASRSSDFQFDREFRFPPGSPLEILPVGGLGVLSSPSV